MGVAELQFEERGSEKVLGRGSRSLTRAEKGEHELLGQVQYSSWSRRCLESRGVNQVLRQVPDKGKFLEVVVHDDFLGGDSGAVPHWEDRQSGKELILWSDDGPAILKCWEDVLACSHLRRQLCVRVGTQRP